MKKSIAILLVIVMILGLTPGALADWGSSSGYSYSVTGSVNLYNASSSQLNNINLAIAQIDGTVLGYGDVFSFNTIVGPRNADKGYKNAVNGRGIQVRGGGVGQVASAVFLAARQLSGIQFGHYITYGNRYTGTYVDDAEDAIVVDYSNGNDLTFVNTLGTMKIEIWTTRDYLYCTISVTPGTGSGSGVSSYYGTLVGSSSIVLTGSNTLRNNVRLACAAINGTALNYCDEFSFNRVVGPRSAANGYGNAINGRGVQNMGGGVAQAASAVYLAVKNLSNVKITEKHTYGNRYNQHYVDSPDDAIVTDYTDKIDFRFSYRGYGTLTIVTYVNDAGSRLVCEVYEKSGW